MKVTIGSREEQDALIAKLATYTLHDHERKTDFKWLVSKYDELLCRVEAFEMPICPETTVAPEKTDWPAWKIVCVALIALEMPICPETTVAPEKTEPAWKIVCVALIALSFPIWGPILLLTSPIWISALLIYHVVEEIRTHAAIMKFAANHHHPKA